MGLPALVVEVSKVGVSLGTSGSRHGIHAQHGTGEAACSFGAEVAGIGLAQQDEVFPVGGIVEGVKVFIACDAQPDFCRPGQDDFFFRVVDGVQMVAQAYGLAPVDQLFHGEVVEGGLEGVDAQAGLVACGCLLQLQGGGGGEVGVLLPAQHEGGAVQAHFLQGYGDGF